MHIYEISLESDFSLCECLTVSTTVTVSDELTEYGVQTVPIQTPGLS